MNLVNLETVRELLSQGGYVVVEERRLGNGSGTQLRLDCQAMVNVYDKGTYNVQGKDNKEVKEYLDGCIATNTDRTATNADRTEASKEIFVVYGHDKAAKDQLAGLLRKWKLEPLILDEHSPEGRTIIGQLEHYTSLSQYAIVLATPDDEGHLAGQPDKKAFRARQNVVLELGMMLAKLGRERVVILLKDPDEMERPSDIDGLIYIPFTGNVENVKTELAKALDKAGYTITIDQL